MYAKFTLDGLGGILVVLVCMFCNFVAFDVNEVAFIDSAFEFHRISWY